MTFDLVVYILSINNTATQTIQEDC